MAEHLARSELVEHALAVDELDGPRADHPHVRRRRRALGEDDVAGGVELDLDGASHGLQGLRLECVERREPPEESGDVVDAHGVSVADRRAARTWRTGGRRAATLGR